MAKTRRDIRFRNVLNARDDLGWRPGNSVDDKLPEDDNTLIEVPPGTYRMNDQHRFSPNKWGLVGLGDRGDTQLISDSITYRALDIRGGRDVLVENIEFDQRTPEQGGGTMGLYFEVETGLKLFNIISSGFSPLKDNAQLRPNDSPGDFYEIRATITGQNGTGEINGFERTGGSVLFPHGNTLPILGVTPRHKGMLYVRNSIFGGSGEHGAYLSNHDGSYGFENCFFFNNNGAQLRVSGDDTFVRNCIFVLDDTNEYAPKLDPPHREPPTTRGPSSNNPANRPGYDGTNGVWFQSETGQDGGVMENCDILIKTTGGYGLRGGIIIEGDVGKTVIRDTRVWVNESGECVDAERFGRGFGNNNARYNEPDDKRLIMDNVQLINTAGKACVKFDGGRPGSILKNSCVQGGGTGGIPTNNINRGVCQMPTVRDVIDLPDLRIPGDVTGSPGGLTPDPGPMPEPEPEPEPVQASSGTYWLALGLLGAKLYQLRYQ